MRQNIERRAVVLDGLGDRLMWDRGVCKHSPIVKGTRVAAATIVYLVEQRLSVTREYPEVGPADIEACIAWDQEQSELIGA